MDDTRSGVLWRDLAVGASLGIVSAAQGVALPGAIVLGAGYDAAAALAYHARPDWFPGQRSPSLADSLATAIGVAAGWAVLRMVVPHPTVQTPSLGAAVAAAGLAVASGGRPAGRLRREPR